MTLPLYGTKALLNSEHKLMATVCRLTPPLLVLDFDPQLQLQRSLLSLSHNQATHSSPLNYAG